MVFSMLLVVFAVTGVILAVFNFVTPKAGGLLVETSPASTVYINGEEVGRTPYSSIRKPGEFTLRLIPDTFGEPLPAFEEKINLVSGVETVVRRYFGLNEDQTEGEILSFEKLSSDDSVGIMIVTDPDNVKTEINSVSVGTTPYTSGSVSLGENILRLSLNGYKERSIKVDVKKGLKLIAIVKLSKEEAKPQVIKEEQKPVEKIVKILSTPTGFLRVRESASSSAKEIGQVKPGEEYSLLEEDKDGDWFKISLKKDVIGWITSQYAKVVEKTSTSSASQAGKLTN